MKNNRKNIQEKFKIIRDCFKNQNNISEEEKINLLFPYECYGEIFFDKILYDFDCLTVDYLLNTLEKIVINIAEKKYENFKIKSLYYKYDYDKRDRRIDNIITNIDNNFVLDNIDILIDFLDFNGYNLYYNYIIINNLKQGDIIKLQTQHGNCFQQYKNWELLYDVYEMSYFDYFNNSLNCDEKREGTRCQVIYNTKKYLTLAVYFIDTEILTRFLMVNIDKNNFLGDIRIVDKTKDNLQNSVLLDDLYYCYFNEDENYVYLTYFTHMWNGNSEIYKMHKDEYYENAISLNSGTGEEKTIKEIANKMFPNYAKMFDAKKQLNEAEFIKTTEYSDMYKFGEKRNDWYDNSQNFEVNNLKMADN